MSNPAASEMAPPRVPDTIPNGWTADGGRRRAGPEPGPDRLYGRGEDDHRPPPGRPVGTALSRFRRGDRPPSRADDPGALRHRGRGGLPRLGSGPLPGMGPASGVGPGHRRGNVPRSNEPHAAGGGGLCVLPVCGFRGTGPTAGGGDRPLLRLGPGETLLDRLRALWAAREAAYRAIPRWIDTTGRPPEAVVEEILGQYWTLEAQGE